MVLAIRHLVERNVKDDGIIKIEGGEQKTDGGRRDEGEEGGKRKEERGSNSFSASSGKNG